MRLIAITFLVLALYILFQLVKKLLFQEVPYPSLQGIIIAVASTIVMPLLSYQKYQTGKQISSKALMADSKETLACFFLSLALLFGLGLNYLLGFWQTDPIVGILIVIFLLTEGIESWRELKEEEDKETGVKLKKKSLEFDIINISVLFPIPGITHQFHNSYKSCENRPVRGASNDGTQSYGSPSHLPL